MNDPDSNVYVCDEVRDVQRLHKDVFSDDFPQLSVREQLDRQAQRILEGHQAGDHAVVTHVTCWHPDLVGHTASDIMGREFSLEDARETIAREYGFGSWADVAKLGAEPPDAQFESAVDALLKGDVNALRAALQQKPSLVNERSRFGHQATLLHYVGSNGVETYRQVVPRNLVEVTKILLDAGADVNATAEIYGGGCTTIALLISSGHPGEAGVMDEMVQVLIDAGAETDNS